MTAIFGTSKMVCGTDFVKLNPWKKCTLVKLGCIVFWIVQCS